MQGFLKGISVEASTNECRFAKATELENSQQRLDHYHLYTAVAFSVNIKINGYLKDNYHVCQLKHQIASLQEKNLQRQGVVEMTKQKYDN